MKPTTMIKQVGGRFTKALGTSYLGTLIGVVAILLLFGISVGTLFGAGIIANIPDRVSVYVGIAFWFVAWLCLLAFIYGTLLEAADYPLWICRVIHVLYWAVRCLVFVVMVSTGDPTAVVIAFWIDWIVFPGFALLFGKSQVCCRK